MEILEIMAATSIAHYKRSCLIKGDELEASIVNAYADLIRIIYNDSVKKEAKEEPVTEEPIAELNSETCTTDYQTIVKKTIPVGKTGYICKVEMALEQGADYSLVNWKLLIDDKVIELESGGTGDTWEDKTIPVAVTMTFPDLRVRESIEIQAKDDGSGIEAYGDITGAIR